MIFKNPISISLIIILSILLTGCAGLQKEKVLKLAHGL
ncbi:unnamed protein product, partial [marine sediment metagenome]